MALLKRNAFVSGRSLPDVSHGTVVKQCSSLLQWALSIITLHRYIGQTFDTCRCSPEAIGIRADQISDKCDIWGFGCLIFVCADDWSLQFVHESCPLLCLSQELLFLDVPHCGSLEDFEGDEEAADDAYEEALGSRYSSNM